VPIDSEALGNPIDAKTGLPRPDILCKNMCWVLDEVLLRLRGAEFCGHKVRAVKALPVTCDSACGAECGCSFGFISEDERLAMRASHKASNPVRAAQ
jgi:hypothetical protein